MDALSDVLSLGSKEQHQRIDKLRELGVAEDISLPQLVVVGDQSSGKSSLLEGLTDLPFPTAADVCTRFATRIVFRRLPLPEDTTSLSIIPGPNATAGHKERLEGFSKDFAGYRLTRENFKDTIGQAPAYMGLTTSDDELDSAPDGRQRFSDDILNIEISGPEQLQLSIIDLPGLFHHETLSQSRSVKELVQNLVEHFIKDSRTIILAVFNAAVNLALQEVFTIAKRFDPQGLRTVGVMTHCDAVQKTAETQPVNIALNRVEKLHHGWYCVRNRTPEEVLAGATIQTRNENEQRFFKESREWSAVSESRRGIKSLRKALYHLLSEHISKEFPMIQAEVNAKLEHARKELDGLGPSRNGDREQTQYLIRLAVTYQQFVLDSLSGQYSVHASQSSKLRTLVQNSNDRFNDAMHKTGCYIPFRSPSTSPSLNNLFRDLSVSKAVNPFPSLPSESPWKGAFGHKLPHRFPEDDIPPIVNRFSPEEITLANYDRGQVQEVVPANGSSLPDQQKKTLVGTQSTGFGSGLLGLQTGSGTNSSGGKRKSPSLSEDKPSATGPIDEPLSQSGKGFGSAPFGTGFERIKVSADLKGVFGSDWVPKHKTRDPTDSGSKLDIYEYIRTKYKESRGTELPGHVNPSLLERLFSEQSRKWQSISTAHVTDIWESISVCHQHLLSEICKSDLTTCGRLAQSFVQEWDASKLRATGVLIRLLEDERNGPLLTRNDEFARNLSAARTERIFSRLKALGFQDGASNTINFQQLASLVHLSNEDFTVYDIHDTLKAYYDVVVKRFIDNVVTQVVEHTLLGSGGPLCLFNTDWVTSLSSSERASLVEEDYATKSRREELTIRIQRLGQASIICSGKDDRP